MLWCVADLTRLVGSLAVCRACLLPACLVLETVVQPAFARFRLRYCHCCGQGTAGRLLWQRNSLGNVLCTAPIGSSAARGLKARGFTHCSVFASVYRSLCVIRVESIMHALLISCAAVAVHTVYYY